MDDDGFQVWWRGQSQEEEPLPDENMFVPDSVLDDEDMFVPDSIPDDEDDDTHEVRDAMLEFYLPRFNTSNRSKRKR